MRNSSLDNKYRHSFQSHRDLKLFTVLQPTQNKQRNWPRSSFIGASIGSQHRHSKPSSLLLCIQKDWYAPPSAPSQRQQPPPPSGLPLPAAPTGRNSSRRWPGSSSASSRSSWRSLRWRRRDAWGRQFAESVRAEIRRASQEVTRSSSLQ